MGSFRCMCLACLVFLIPVLHSIAGTFPGTVDDFAYHLQNYSNGLNPLRDSRFDLAVIDYSSDGMATGEWEASALSDAKLNGPCGGKIILAYFSIGEAEDYRYYWDSSWVNGSGQPIPGVAPDWLGPTNPDWPGNYKVRYWMPGWQSILFGTASGPSRSYLDRIIDAGFDGVYLDIVDAFEYWGPSDLGGTNENREAAHDMVDLVEMIAEYARVTRARPGFLVVPQNGAVIIEPDAYPDASDPDAEALAQRNRYFSIINAIGAEDAFFGGDLDENNPYNPDDYMIELLGRFRTGGIPVLSIEYLTDPTAIGQYYDQYAQAEGFIPYATVRALDRMTINTGFEPDCEASECTALNARIIMPSQHFSQGSMCACRVDICLPQGTGLLPFPLFVILEVAGSYFFAPDFSPFDYYSPTWIIGINSIQVLPEFTWPDTSSSPFSATWYAGLTDPGMTQLVGEIGTLAFDWN